MKREDFKEIKKVHIETAKRIIEDNGTCERICCHECPFCVDNSENNLECEGTYSTFGEDPMDNDIKLLQSAKEFLEMCKSTRAIIGEGTVAEDNINSPKHYKLPGLNIESIDIIRAILGKYFKWFCLGNILKYIIRAEKKNGLEDYKKARKYLDWLIKGEEK